MNNQIITHLDWLLAPFYILIIVVIATRIKNREIKRNPIYKFFLWGLFAKVFGAICVCLIYVYYYKQGGDTLAYHQTGQVLVNVLFDSPLHFFKILFGATTPENYSYFNNQTDYPYFWTDKQAFNVSRLSAILEFASFKSYVITSVLIAVISFTGIWKLYSLFCEIYPNLYKQFAFSVLFLPSLVFWGSGLLKDSWTLSAACWFCVSFYQILIKKEKIFFYLIALIISSSILIFIKPYIFIGILPGCIIWMTWNRINRIKNLFFRIFAGPFFICIGALIIGVVWINLSSNFGEYSSLDKMLTKAQVASEDLKQDYYQGNSFDLGAYDPTLVGVLSKFFPATIAGLYRPFLWEAKNVVMIMSGIENFLLLIFSLYCFLKQPIIFFRTIISNPMVIFCLSFAVIFAFSVALSTSNFGALVRLRIPMLPFFLSGLFVIYFNTTKEIVLGKRIQSVIS